jgi:hypothetical protein
MQALSGIYTITLQEDLQQLGLWITALVFLDLLLTDRWNFSASIIGLSKYLKTNLFQDK